MLTKAVLSIAALVSFNIFTTEYTLDKSLIKPQKGVGELSVIHTKDGFYTEQNGNKLKATIPTNSPLLKMDHKQVKALIKTGSYLTIEKLDNGQHKIELKSKLKGGGFWGGMAGFWGGQVLVHGVTQGICWGTAGVVGIFCPPLFLPTLATMEKVTAVPSTIIANKVAIGLGVVGAVATGPV